jgi:hypothetical protein
MHLEAYPVIFLSNVARLPAHPKFVWVFKKHLFFQKIAYNKL